MTTALAWLWLPVVVAVTALGVGLLVERVARHRLAEALLVPVGFAVAIVFVTTGYKLGLTRNVVLPLLLALCVAGFVAGRAGLLARLRPGPAGFAALGVFALYLAPVALTGHWTWPGYNFTNDQSLTFLGADWIVHHGAVAPADPRSTSQILAGQMIDIGYPLGGHLLLSTLLPVAGIALAPAFQPFVALAAGLAAAAMVHLIRGAGMSPWTAALAALTASGACLLYAYGQLGGLKEITTVLLLVTAAAVAQNGILARLQLGAVAIAALVLVALVPVLSAGGVAYAGLLALAIAAAVVCSRKRPSWRRLGAAAGVGLVVFALGAAASLEDLLNFGGEVSGTFASNSDVSSGVLGQLLRPLPVGETAGIWFAEDWRLAVGRGVRWDVNAVLIGAILALALLGLVLALRRRSGLGLLAVAAAGVTVVLMPRLSPYGDSKLLIVLTPFVLLLGAYGVSAIARRRRPLAVAAGVVAAVLVAGVAYSDALIYREVRLAPTDRIEAMEAVAHAAEGRGLTLFNEWEEYAKYFARAAQINVPGEIAGPRPFELRTDQPIFGQHFDLDRQKLAYVLSHPAIITRRGPGTSRPPASYRRVYANRYYELWVRGAAVRVSAHLSAQGFSVAQKVLPCALISRFARRARRGESLLAHRRSAPVVMDTVNVKDRSAGWVKILSIRGTVVPLTPGQARLTVSMKAGRYRAWVRGTSGRPLQAIVDGRTVGALRHVNTPGQYIDVGEVTVSGGRHRLELRRGGGSLRPGDGYQGGIGPLVLQPLDGVDGYVRVAPRDARRLCGRSLDWIERVSGQIPSKP